MAYSDYGGYAFREGERIEDRSDAVLTTDGVKSTPGMWPGWTIPEGRGGGCFHVLLGDGPIHVGLHKQSTLTIHRMGEEVDPLNVAVDLPKGAVNKQGRYRYFDCDYFKDAELPCVFEIDGHKITARWVNAENHYLFVRVEQPDGIVWHGWSGYGVGAGLDDDSYGFSTKKQNERLVGFWPDAIA